MAKKKPAPKAAPQVAPRTLKGEKLTWKQRVRLMRIEMSTANLKMYGGITLFFYAFSFAIIQNGLMHTDSYAPGALNEAIAADPDLMLLATLGSITQLIGGLGIPVFAFLLVEGFVRTGSVRKYFTRMFVFALISEVPFDLAIYGKVWDMRGQNLLFTYCVCLVMLYGLRMFVGQKGLRFWVLRIMLMGAAVLWILLIKSQFGLASVALCVVYYMMYDSKGMRCVIGAAVSVTYVTAPLSAYALYKFNGEKGKLWNKYVYYAIYPAHLLILGVMALWMSR